MIEMKLEITKADVDVAQELEKNLEAFFREVLDRILQLAQDNIVRNQSVVSGFMLRSGRSEFDKALWEGFVIFAAPYSTFVEYGTRPHTPPLGKSLAYHKTRDGRVIITEVPDQSTNPLDWWAWRKGAREGIITRGLGVHTKLGFGVWNKIRKYGTEAAPFLRPAIDQVRYTEMPRIAQKYGLELE